ncbi:transposase, partial [Bifidobacterium criceti]
MISMSVIHSIRCMRKEGASVAAIARELGISEPTVRKYLREVDLSDRPPVRRERPSKIDRWVPLIEGWLAEDRRTWSKQRHTATRIHRRLVDECGADVSLSTVTRKVRELKREFGLERQRGFLDLSWHPGEAQADFGQSDVYWKGVRRRMHYFVLSFPHS